MAALRLESYRGDELPGVCMKCGAPATLFKSKTFSWFPPWIWLLFIFCGLLPFAIVALIMTKRRTLGIPLCDKHKNHWLWRQLLVLGTLLCIIPAAILAFAMLDGNKGGGGDVLGGLACVGTVILLLGWLILAIIVQLTSIRAKEITDRAITLAGIADEFIEAYETEWHVSPDRMDELAREHWQQGGRPTRGKRAAEEDSDRIQPGGDDESHRSPPDSIQEGPA